MNNNKQSSIDWLIKQIKHDHNEKCLTGLEWMKIFEQAKAMHKEEIKNAVGVGSQFDRDYLYGYHDKAEQYYNETFE